VRILNLFWPAVLLCAAAIVADVAEAASVWKITGAEGHVLYLGGSIHALNSADYPLPAAYNRAFDASHHLVFEVDHKALVQSSKGLTKAGEYPRGDSLKNHVDPRTYAYLRHLFALMKIPEERIVKYRPWYLALALQAPSLRGLSEELGVEEFLAKRAQANSKPVSGLESAREHLEVFSGLTDRQSEAMLLLMFIPAEKESSQGARLNEAWRKGDADTETRVFMEGFRDFPSLGERLLAARNRKWIPKIEQYLRSGQTSFVIVGAAHMGGREGVLALLQAHGYKIEQL
jgi:uncharacterized protein